MRRSRTRSRWSDRDWHTPRSSLDSLRESLCSHRRHAHCVFASQSQRERESPTQRQARKIFPRVDSRPSVAEESPTAARLYSPSYCTQDAAHETRARTPRKSLPPTGTLVPCPTRRVETRPSTVSSPSEFDSLDTRDYTPGRFHDGARVEIKARRKVPSRSTRLPRPREAESGRLSSCSRRCRFWVAPPFALRVP